MEQTKLDIGKNLLKFRKIKNYSQTDVAKATGMKQPNYCEIESNTVVPTIATLKKLAEFLEVPISKLMEEDEIKMPQHSVNIIGDLNNNNNSNNNLNFFEKFEQKEIMQTLQSTIADAVADALAKLTKNV